MVERSTARHRVQFLVARQLLLFGAMRALEFSMRRGIGIAACLVAAMGCSADGDSANVSGAPDRPDLPTPPTDPPPTGQKWETIEVGGSCGRTGLAYILIDEVCGGTEDPDYLDYFRAPMFRDGARIGDFMFSVDGTHLWVLDAGDVQGMTRHVLQAGIGEPLAVAALGQKLVVAAGSAGVLIFDVQNPLEPVLDDQVALDGPALDVHVEGSDVYVAMGNAGMAVFTPSQGFSFVKTLPVPGFAAAITAREGLAYVAGCDEVSVIDVINDQLLSNRWLDSAYDGEVLVAPAKDIEVVGDTAFVAAGRFGAVAMDVSDPTSTFVRGNCTLVDDQAFYASGVRAEGTTLYVAGGEYGILPVDIAVPNNACNGIVFPELPQLPGDSEDCATQPPWEYITWTETFPPPPPARDPIQTLPFGDVVYAFGDARRIGLRAIDTRDADSLELLGRYDEPRVVTGVAAFGDRVIVLGPAGGSFLADPNGLLTADEPIPTAINALGVTTLDDGRWAMLTAEGQLAIEGLGVVLDSVDTPWSEGLAAAGQQVAVPTAEGAIVVDGTDAQGAPIVLASAQTSALPPAIAMTESAVALASPEWTTGESLDLQGTPPINFAPHEVFTAEDVMSGSTWRQGLPRRLLVATGEGVAEVATLGTKAGLTIHGLGVSTALPPANYVAGTVLGGQLFLITADRGSYRSQLVTVDFNASEASVVSSLGFSGLATDVAAANGRLYIADADRGVRVYDVAGATPQPLGVVEVSP